MIFLKLTRTAKTFFTRFGWLLAELLFVFLGLYGAFLLEGYNDEKADLMRKHHILQALADEFEGYEEELYSASASIDEEYAVPFFSAYGSEEADVPLPFPTPIPYGGLSSVNTGVWEAMLQSGGIDVLEVELIQRVQSFVRKLQDLLDLFARFERLTSSLILPEMDRNASFFYLPESRQLRSKYEWYADQLYNIGTSLQELSEQAEAMKKYLNTELKKVPVEE